MSADGRLSKCATRTELHASKSGERLVAFDVPVKNIPEFDHSKCEEPTDARLGLRPFKSESN